MKLVLQTFQQPMRGRELPECFALVLRLTSHLTLNSIPYTFGWGRRPDLILRRSRLAPVLRIDRSTPMSQVFLCAPNRPTDTRPSCSKNDRSADAFNVIPRRKGSVGSAVTSVDVKRHYTPGSLLCSMQEVKSEQDGGG